jgi:hypothetical protein
MDPFSAQAGLLGALAVIQLAALLGVGVLNVVGAAVTRSEANGICILFLRKM